MLILSIRAQPVPAICVLTVELSIRRNKNNLNNQANTSNHFMVTKIIIYVDLVDYTNTLNLVEQDLILTQYRILYFKGPVLISMSQRRKKMVSPQSVVLSVKTLIYFTSTLTKGIAHPKFCSDTKSGIWTKAIYISHLSVFHPSTIRSATSHFLNCSTCFKHWNSSHKCTHDPMECRLYLCLHCWGHSITEE